MKKIFLLIVLFLGANFIFPQDNGKDHERFSIVNFGQVKDLAFYVNSINASNLEGWRLKDKRTTLKFDTGFEIELLSATELKTAGFNVDPVNYKNEFPPNYQMPVFNVFPNGTLGAAVNPVNKTAKKK